MKEVHNIDKMPLMQVRAIRDRLADVLKPLTPAKDTKGPMDFKAWTEDAEDWIEDVIRGSRDSRRAMNHWIHLVGTKLDPVWDGREWHSLADINRRFIRLCKRAAELERAIAPANRAKIRKSMGRRTNAKPALCHAAGPPANDSTPAKVRHPPRA